MELSNVTDWYDFLSNFKFYLGTVSIQWVLATGNRLDKPYCHYCQNYNFAIQCRPVIDGLAY